MDFNLLTVCIIPLTSGQIDRQRKNDHGWEIKLNVPGAPGNDYPTLHEIPRTSFNCAGREPGYYADQETNCQVFRICTSGSIYGFQSFLCPNGTLFNQAFFVCDWWMNVNCGKSQEVHNNNERFANLKPGPQLIKDVRKIITHPMRNPIKSEYLRSKDLVPQLYKPPLQELFPNGALISSQDLNNNNVYVPSKTSIDEDIVSNDISFAASTASPQFTSYRSNQQTQRLEFSNPRTHNTQYNQLAKPQSTPIRYLLGTPIPIKQKQVQYNQNNKNHLTYGQRTLESYRVNPRKQSPQSLYQLQTNGNAIITEAKENLVSTQIPPTVISKTIAFKSIVPGDKAGGPKSRITFKTWILKPKGNKLIVKPIAYTNKNIVQSPSEQVSSTVIPYVYDKPTPSSDLIRKSNEYFYTKPVSAKQVTNIPVGLYDPPTTFRPTLPSRLYLSPNLDIATTTVPSLYEVSTLKSLPNIYLPPTNSAQLSRQYLSPLVRSQQLINNNEKLQTESSSQTPQYELIEPIINNLPSLTVTKHSKINTNRNNLTFTDIITQEKYDITVNNVEKTRKAVFDSAPQKITQYQDSNFINSDYLKRNGEFESKKNLPASIATKSAKLISAPSINLEPPFESNLQYFPSNKITNLPYYKEPVNTIERTVSIKITIPEKIAKILFKNESNSEELEVLNTGSSNYYVYANNLGTESDNGLTPIGKISLIKNSNISRSQDLVFSFLADSLNAAKQYSNIATRTEPTSTETSTQNNEYNDEEEISKQISHLTSLQFSNNNDINTFNDVQSLPQNKDINQLSKHRQHNENNQQVHQQSSRLVTSSSQNPNQLIRQETNKFANLLQNPNQIYSGQLYQLPVPDVTREFYNSPKIQPSINQNTQQRIKSQDFIKQQNSKLTKGTDVELLPSPFSKHQQSSPIERLKQNDLSTNFDNLLSSGNGITAQVKDSIVGSLPHPSENDKLLTYKKDQSYYIFSQLHNNKENQFHKTHSANLEIVPSIAYKLKDQVQNNEFRRPGDEYFTSKQSLTTNVDYTVNHPINYGDRLSNSQFNSPYSQQNQRLINNDENSRIEDLDSKEPNGYPKISPQPKFNT
ncbi:unnamed protein product [Leptosia nina]|uniref:Chitin-binding type-2 domain-containing protein n=1 Tax=Leptosia nina TaxID=320188 RepID=A0AAV1JMV9_9NEOP